MRVYGIDGFQVLTLAIWALRTEIDVLNKELDGKLRCEAGPANEFGQARSS